MTAGALPNFFIIGAPKCGTTTLYNWLKSRNDVYMPGKEICFFSQDIFPTITLVGHIPDLRAYSALYSTPDSDGKVRGDATPKYLHSDRALHEIRQLSPSARLIVCLRDPVELAISLHSQKVAEGKERQVNFAKAWIRELQVTTPEAARLRPGETNYVFWAHLGNRLERLFTIFNRNEVLVLHLREFRQASRVVYNRVLKFLDLPDDRRELLHTSNQRIGFVSPTINFLALTTARLAEPALRPLRQIRGGRGFGLLKAINHFNVIDDVYVGPVDKLFRHTIYDFLASDIALAESYLEGVSLTDRLLDD